MDTSGTHDPGARASAPRSWAVWIYLASAATSMLGNAVATIVWPWLVLDRTGDPAAAGLVAAAIAFPSLLFAFLGGHLIDTFGRKPMSIISDLISAASVVGVIIVDARLGLTMAWFVALGIIGAVGDIPGMAARSALVGDVSRVSGMTVDRIAGLNQSIGGLSWLLGPALAGFMMATIPIQLVLWITAGCSFAAALLTAMLRLHPGASDPTPLADDGSRGSPPEGGDPAGSVPGSSVPGSGGDPGAEAAAGGETIDIGALRAWGRVVRPPAIRLLVIITFASAALVSPYLAVLLPAHFQSIDAPAMLGLSMSTYAVGMVLAGLAVAKIGAQNRRAMWTTAIALDLIGFSMLGALGVSWLVIAGMFVAGVGGGFLGPLSMVLVTEDIPEKLRGRAFSVFTAVNQFAAPIGLVAVTALLTQADIYLVAAILAVIWAFISVWAIARGFRIFPPHAPASADKGSFPDSNDPGSGAPGPAAGPNDNGSVPGSARGN